MMKKLLRLATLALLFTGVASAQSTGSITGVVTDGASGKPVVGVVVVATSPASPGEKTAVTDAKGAFTFAGLPAGQYKLQASFEGYKPETRSDLALGDNVTLRANLAIVPEAVQLEEVVVTGSRIKRKDLTAPAPVTVVSKEQMNAMGKVSLSEFLQAMPEQSGGLNAQVNNGTDGSTSVDLRSLGAQRTLVLVNGRRFVGGPATNITDLSAIPTAAVERVEILKDGASAVYGSDAIAGVVNVILKKRFNGTEVSGYVGNSSRNDGSQADVSIVTGTGNEKGNFLFSLGYTRMEPIRSRDRKFAETSYSWGPWDGTGDPGWYATGNSTTFPNGRFTLPAAACVAPTTPEAVQACAARPAGTTGNVGMWATPTGQGTATYSPYDGTLFNTNTTNYLITPSQKIQVFTTGDGNLGNVARAYFEASYNKRNSAFTLAPMPLVNNTIPTNPVTVSANSLYNPFGVNITSWRIRTAEFGDRYWKDESVAFRTVVGLDGALGDWAGPLRGWGWDASYNYGNTTFVELSTGQLRMPNVANATGPSMIFNGTPICVRVAGDPTTKINGCVPMDVLHGNGNIAGHVPTGGTYAGQLAALKSYVSFDGTNRGVADQQILSASLGGELFRLMSDRPAGLALGVDRRYEAGGYFPDVITTALESSGNNQLSTQGSFTATEAFAELSLPIVNKIPFAEELELSLAARTVKYSNFGTNNTFKIGARYTPVKDFTLRGTYSTALRAPNVTELFGGAADNYPSVRDPCRSVASMTATGTTAACAAQGVPANGTGDNSTQILTKQGSNLDLQPEKAKVITAGVVIEPRWVPNLSLTADYYVIKVTDAIGYFGAANVLNQCLMQGNAAYCPSIHRDLGNRGAVIYIDDKRMNLAKEDTAGIDLAARYAFPTESFGRFNAGVDMTILQYHNYTDGTGFLIRGKGSDDLGIPMPSFKALAQLGWSMAGFNVGANVRYVGKYKECGTDYCMNKPPDNPDNIIHIKSYSTVNLNAGYTVKTGVGTTTWVVGVQNVADTQPPFLYFAAAANTDPYTYDYIGRYFYTRLTQTF